MVKSWKRKRTYSGNARTWWPVDVYARFYDKLAQYRENQLVTSDIREHWKKQARKFGNVQWHQGAQNGIVRNILKGSILIKSSKLSSIS